MEHAVESSKAAFKSWSKTSVMRRQQIMFRYQEIIKANMVNLIYDAKFLYVFQMWFYWIFRKN